jgi:hypothetical protein
MHAGIAADCVGQQFFHTLHLEVETDRGATEFVLRGDEDIRRVDAAGNALLVADSHGIQYLVRDQLALDAHSRKILDRFL